MRHDCSVVPATAASTFRSQHRRDARGHIVTGGDHGAVAAIDRFTDIVLRRSRDAEFILEAASAYPQCPMLQACGAIYHLLCDTRSGIESALPMLERARGLLFAATDRETIFVDALSAIARGRTRLADSLFLTLAQTAPEDLLAGYVGHLHYLNHGRFDAMLVHARHLHRTNPCDPFSLGMLSFALQETGETSAALDAAYEANAIDPSIAWVHHTFAHVFKTQGRAPVGVAWLTRQAHYWESCGSSMLTHNWWHIQLLLLEIGDAAAALALYDRWIASEKTQCVSSFVNVSSLLARLERRGVDVGSRWLPLAEYARQRIGEHVLPFIDLHYGLALGYASDFDGCNALKRSASRHASRLGGNLREAWQLAGLPMIDAVVASCLGDWRSAHQSFARAITHILLIGGRAQQRELFHEFQAHAGRCASAARMATSGCAAPSARKRRSSYRIAHRAQMARPARQCTEGPWSDHRPKQR